MLHDLVLFVQDEEGTKSPHRRKSEGEPTDETGAGETTETCDDEEEKGK